MSEQALAARKGCGFLGRLPCMGNAQFSGPYAESEQGPVNPSQADVPTRRLYARNTSSAIASS
ncbi:MAG: hypothetical protein ACLGJD_08110, partial [Gammaproteobacteria bacterium]